MRREKMKKRSALGWLAAVPASTALLMTVLLISSCSAPMGNPEDGKRWYSMNHCDSCHGINGNDGKAPVVKNLDMSFWRFKRIIRDAGSQIMPKFPEEKISEQDVADLYAFLKAEQ
jgi:mono/diheme cytochrome c family protein